MPDKKGKITYGPIQRVPDVSKVPVPEWKYRTNKAYDPTGKKLKYLEPEERQGGVEFYDTAAGVIGPEDVPDGAGKEAILKAIKERGHARQRYRDKNPESRGSGSKRMYRRDI